jgi:hypothetical protein
MKMRVQIDKKSLTSEGFPICRILQDSDEPLATLDVQTTRFAFPTLPGEVAVDFFLIASTVYAIDKLIHRSEAEDNWTRQFNVTIPVSSPKIWQQAARIPNGQDKDGKSQFISSALPDKKSMDEVMDALKTAHRELTADQGLKPLATN